MKKTRIKLFLENIVFYGGLTMLTKVLPFITLPIITRLLPDSSSYGIMDLFSLIVSFGIAIAIPGFGDAIFREFFDYKDDNEYQKKITATGLNLALVTSSFICIVIFLLKERISFLLFNDTKYQSLIIFSGISILFGAISSIASLPNRIRNERKVFFFTGVSFPLIGFLLTIFFIKKNFTYEALLYSSLIVSLISSCFYLFFNNKDFNIFVFDRKVVREIIKVGVPLLPTCLIYWIFNSMDRIMISKMLNASQLGIYSIGAKVASISQLIYTAFASGWSFFAYSTMKDEDQVSLTSNIFKYLLLISIVLYIISIPFIRPVFIYFFSGSYIEGYKVFSYLFLSPLLLMLFQVLASQAIIIKKAYIITLSLVVGAMLNVLFNYYLIEFSGIAGAAFSTLLGYIFSILIMAIISIKNKAFFIEKKLLIIIGIFISTLFIDFFLQNKYYYCLVLITIVLSYYLEISVLIKKIIVKK